ncbi:MAG TPA: DUF4139 domain-containing protein [Polyangiaceae bacterium]|nr:DUF4139 domain-containing protein [Polyangiaceae bacterium]
MISKHHGLSNWTRRAAFGLGLLALASGCARKPPALPPGPARAATSDARTREHVGVTVYNQNFGLVREKRRVQLGEGLVELAYGDVASELQAETVHIRSLDDADALAVLEQNYRYDLLSPETLLKKYVGKTIQVYRYNEQLGTEEKKAADVLAVEKGVVLRIDGQVTYDFPGRYAFPGVPENLLAKPTLVWLLASHKPQQSLEVSYLTRGLNWQADYVLVLAADEKTSDLTGWVSLSNESGASYENAELKLVAGDVQRVTPPPPPQAPMPMTEAMDAAANVQQFRQEGLFEYHLYTLERPTTLRDKEKKQVSLLEAHAVAVQKKLVFRGNERFFPATPFAPLVNQKVSVFVELMNSEKNHLGQPLPKGVVRVYKADQGGAQQFVGEDTIDHTARDEKIRIRLGEAFDVVADRKQLRTAQLGSCLVESEWEVALRNHKDAGERVEVEEPAGGDWEIVKSTQPARRVDAHTFSFDVELPARGEKKLSYTVRVRYC